MSTLVEQLTDAQVTAIIDKVVPLVADEADHSYFRAVLALRAQAATSSADFASFVARLLKEAEGGRLVAWTVKKDDEGLTRGCWVAREHPSGVIIAIRKSQEAAHNAARILQEDK